MQAFFFFLQRSTCPNTAIFYFTRKQRKSNQHLPCTIRRFLRAVFDDIARKSPDAEKILKRLRFAIEILSKRC